MVQQITHNITGKLLTGGYKYQNLYVNCVMTAFVIKTIRKPKMAFVMAIDKIDFSPIN